MNNHTRLRRIVPIVGAVAGCVCGVGPGFAQSRVLPIGDPFTVRAYTIADGLPLSDVREVEQAGDGRLLIASGRELTQFDGYSFREMRLEGFESSFVRWMQHDRSGRVWLISDMDDLGFLDPDGRFRALPRPPAEPFGLTETRDGAVWLGTARGLFRINPESDATFEAIGATAGLPTDTIAGLVELPDGARVVVSMDGLYTSPPGAWGDARFTRVGPSARPVTPNLRNNVYLDSSGLWIATENGGIRYDGATLHDYPRREHDRALALEDFTWTSRGGVVPLRLALLTEAAVSGDAPRIQRLARILDATTGTRVLASSPLDDQAGIAVERDGRVEVLRLASHFQFGSVNDIMEDREGSIWIATDRGLLQLAPRLVFSLDPDAPLPETFTTAILQTRDSVVWVGTWGGGLQSLVNGRPGPRFTMEDGLADNQIRALYEDASGMLWVGSRSGITAIRGRPVGTVPGPWTRSLAETVTRDGDRVLAAGSRQGLLFIPLKDVAVAEISSYEPFPDEDFGTEIWALHADASGGLWIGGDGGLFHVRGDSVRRYGAEQGLVGDEIASIHGLSDGSLWVSTYRNGLYRVDREQLARLTTSNGLPSDGIWAIVEDGQGGVWMSSDFGIVRIALDRLHAVADSVSSGLEGAHDLAPLRFTEAEGMAIHESNRASPAGRRLSDGTIVFNSVDGLAIIDPERAMRPIPTPRTAIQDVLSDGISAGPLSGPSLELSVGTRHVTFEFAVLSFATPSQRRYRYRLDGYDDQWVEGGEAPRASYTRLSPGTYAFRVQGASGRTGWGPEARYSVVLPGFFWQTGWFRVAALLAVLGAGILAYRARVGHLLAIERLRVSIASDLHDDVGSNLSSIALLTEMLEDRTELRGLERRQLARIGAAASETIESLREIIWLVDPNHGRLADLVSRMHAVAGRMLEGVSHSTAVTGTLPDVALEMPWMRNVLLAFKESLHNVVKHSEATRVDIRIAFDDGSLSIEVHDDGVGLEESEICRGYGRANMRRRMEELGGTFQIVSEPGAGATVRLRAPLR